MPKAWSSCYTLNKAYFINWVLMKKRLKSCPSQGKSIWRDYPISAGVGRVLGTWNLHMFLVQAWEAGRTWPALAGGAARTCLSAPAQPFGPEQGLPLASWSSCLRGWYSPCWRRKKKQAAVWAFTPSPWSRAQGSEGGRGSVCQIALPFRDPDLSFMPPYFFLKTGMFSQLLFQGLLPFLL